MSVYQEKQTKKIINIEKRGKQNRRCLIIYLIE